MTHLNIGSLRCSTQVALLGAITPNLRAVNVEFINKHVTIFFYYNSTPSEDEKEISSVVAAEVSCDFIDIIVDSENIILPKPNRIPEVGLRIFQIKE
jgi:hypothetical protein